MDELLGQMESAVFYRPAKIDNETAKFIEECLSYKSGFAHSRTEHEHGESQGESETRIPVLTAHQIKMIDKTQVIVQMEGVESVLAQRLDWRDFPELKRRAAIPSLPVSPLPRFDVRLSQPEHRRLQPLSSWHFDSNLFRRWRFLEASAGEGEYESP